MAVNTDIMKQYRDLVRNIDSFSNGQASIAESPLEEEDTLTIIYVNISPNDGPYKGGTFKFKFDLSDDYPDISPPKINCLTKVYHPNIDQIDDYSEGDICLNLLDELWTPELTLEDYIQGLLFLFYNPNIEDPLNPAFYGSESEDEFKDNVQRSMKGEEIDGIIYDIVLFDEAETNIEGEETKLTTPTEAEGKETELTTPTEDDGTPLLEASEEQNIIEKIHPDQDEIEIKMKTEDTLTTPTAASLRDEATGQHKDIVVPTLKEFSPPLYQRFLTPNFIMPYLRPSQNTKQYVKDLVQYSVTFLLVRVGVYVALPAGLYLLKRPLGIGR